MKVTVHGVNEEININGKTIGEVFDLIEAQDLVVYQVFADGKDISNINEEEFNSLGEIEDLEVVVKDVKTLTLETIKEAEDFIPEFIKRIRKFLDRINEGTEEARFIVIQQLLDTLQWLTSLLENLDGYVDNSAKKARDEFIGKWQETIENLFVAVERRDLVLISDVLEYELIPTLEEYKDFIKVTNNKMM